jgi:hypothetical protein
MHDNWNLQRDRHNTSVTLKMVGFFVQLPPGRNLFLLSFLQKPTGLASCLLAARNNKLYTVYDVISWKRLAVHKTDMCAQAMVRRRVPLFYFSVQDTNRFSAEKRMLYSSAVIC